MMRLNVINSNSAGNCYILENDSEALLIECGVRFEQIKVALNFNLRKVVGAIVTHEHKDHCKGVHDVLKAGIDVWASAGTHAAMWTTGNHRSRITYSGDQFKAGGFDIKAFDVKHDAAEPLGYLIHHKETGIILFLTDSYYCEYTFRNLNHVIIEANYCETILKKRYDDQKLIKVLRDRVITSHMSLDTCKQTLKAYDLAKVKNIVLIHLSDSHSDARRFKLEVEEQTGKMVHVAEPGLSVDFNVKPF